MPDIAEPPARPWTRITAQDRFTERIVQFVLFPVPTTGLYRWIAHNSDYWADHGDLDLSPDWDIVSVDYDGDDPPRPEVPTGRHAVVAFGDDVVAIRCGTYLDNSPKWMTVVYDEDGTTSHDFTNGASVSHNIERVIFEGE